MHKINSNNSDFKKPIKYNKRDKPNVVIDENEYVIIDNWNYTATAVKLFDNYATNKKTYEFYFLNHYFPGSNFEHLF